MKHKKLCTNCKTEMQFMKREQLQLGKTSWFFGDWPNLLAGAQEVEFWVCPECSKLDFYLVHSDGDSDAGDAMARIICPVCGVEHELDDPKCPRCGAKNTRI